MQALLARAGSGQLPGSTESDDLGELAEDEEFAVEEHAHRSGIVSFPDALQASWHSRTGSCRGACPLLGPAGGITLLWYSMHEQHVGLPCSLAWIIT